MIHFVYEEFCQHILLTIGDIVMTVFPIFFIMEEVAVNHISALGKFHSRTIVRKPHEIGKPH